MKPIAVILLCSFSAVAFAQNEPGVTRASLEQAQANADESARRESDLSSQIAAQERANAAIREQLRKTGGNAADVSKDLVNASADAAALRRRVAEQRLRSDVAEGNLNAARERVAASLAQSDKMKSAQRDFEEAADEMDIRSQPILERLSQDPGYQEAQALSDAAAQTGEALHGFDAVDPKTQAQADAAFDQAMAHVRELEDAAVDADPQAAKAHQALKRAQDVLEGLQKENEQAIAADPKVDGAQFAYDLEKRKLDESGAELAIAEKRLSGLRAAAGPNANAGPVAQLTGELKAGETRLHDLSDQLDQVRVARQEADRRVREINESLSNPPAEDQIGGLAPLPPAQIPYLPEPGYTYAPPPVSYAYPSVDPYYYPFDGYFAPGLYFGTVYYSHPRYHSYFYDRYCTARYYSHYHNDHWRQTYAHYRGHDGGDWRYRDGHFASARGLGSASFLSRYGGFTNMARPDLTLDSRNYGRLPSAIDRQYSSGLHVSTYGYPGSSYWRMREGASVSGNSSRFDADARSGLRGDSNWRRSGSVIDDRGLANLDRSTRVTIIRRRPDGSVERSESADAPSRSRSVDVGRTRSEASVRSEGSVRSRDAGGSVERSGRDVGTSVRSDRDSGRGRTRGGASSSLGSKSDGPRGDVGRGRSSGIESSSARSSGGSSRGSAGASLGPARGGSGGGSVSGGGAGRGSSGRSFTPSSAGGGRSIERSSGGGTSRGESSSSSGGGRGRR